MDVFLPASLPARLLAAVIDFVVISGLFIACSQLLPEVPDGLISLLSGGIYFTLAHSFLAKGQTIGKSLLGLKVVRLTAEDHSGNLPIFRAFLRYLASFGVMVTIAEVPPAVFRSQALMLPAWQLELHMLLALAYFFALCVSVLVDPLQRGLHDLLAGSLVVRPQTSDVDFRLPLEIPSRVPLACLGAAVFAFLPWWIGIARPESVNEILRRRYVLENRLEIRVMNAQEVSDGILIEALLLNADGLRGKEGQKRFLENSEAILRTSETPSPPKIRYRLYADPSVEPLTKNGLPLEVSMESATLSGSSTSAPSAVEDKPAH